MPKIQKYMCPPAPVSHTAYDLRNTLLIFDSWRLRHMNLPHTGGTRYALVLYNKNLDYVGTDCDARSVQLKRTATTKQDVVCVPVSVGDNKATANAQQALLAILRRTRFPVDTTNAGTARTGKGRNSYGSMKYGTNTARYLSFGAIASRKCRQKRAQNGLFSRRESNANNKRMSELYAAVLHYICCIGGPDLCGERPECRFHSFIVAKDSQCVWHYDYNNLGPAAITAVGDYTGGGELLVETDTKEDKTVQEKSTT